MESRNAFIDNWHYIFHDYLLSVAGHAPTQESTENRNQ